MCEMLVNMTPSSYTKPACLKQIDADIDNVRAALNWCFRNDLEMGMRLTAATASYWVIRGRLIEARFWLEQYLQACRQVYIVSPGVIRDSLNSAASLAFWQD